MVTLTDYPNYNDHHVWIPEGSFSNFQKGSKICREVVFIQQNLITMVACRDPAHSATSLRTVNS